MQELIALEEQGWRALCTGGEAAKAFYDAVLTDEAVMVFPGGMLIEGKAQILQSIDAQPWTTCRALRTSARILENITILGLELRENSATVKLEFGENILELHENNLRTSAQTRIK